MRNSFLFILLAIISLQISAQSTTVAPKNTKVATQKAKVTSKKAKSAAYNKQIAAQKAKAAAKQAKEAQQAAYNAAQQALIGPRESIIWLTWEEANEKMQKEPKNIFVDMYTDWCGWCKHMDATTFKNHEVARYLNDNYYAVKFNAEQREPVTYEGFEFQFVENGRRGYHQLAHSMLNGRLGFPAFVYFNQKMERIMISPGFKEVPQILGELEFAKEDKYKTMNLQQFLQTKAQAVGQRTQP